MTRNDDLVEQLKKDYVQADLDARVRAMLDYATKLTLAPYRMAQSDVQRLRDAGLSDTAILDLSMVVGYFAFVNRIADGLGVELESWWHTENE